MQPYLDIRLYSSQQNDPMVAWLRAVIIYKFPIIFGNLPQLVEMVETTGVTMETKGTRLLLTEESKKMKRERVRN